MATAAVRCRWRHYPVQRLFVETALHNRQVAIWMLRKFSSRHHLEVGNSLSFIRIENLFFGVGAIVVYPVAILVGRG